jgi:hypothetical protein
MRFAPLVALAAGLSILAATAYEADAQSRRDQRPRVFIKKRSYLDAGTEVKPQSKSYHDYAYGFNQEYPSYGFDPTGQSRWPLARQFELPNY